ncbi:FMN-dependent NADH-azoreductase [Cedecea davisae]|uniref:FMN dependent NADH:quinone oxidoreductase n=2 Tax=Cedecea davisae TaxID=158484 RepID=S3JRH9_9ENTR|nr:FMN-dependent NADH-azoreductase [Cedecea davisae]EPF15809.1 flavodoxin-like protein [Cedecea davisae DSM 4568]SUX38627.1 FMN-dependent NADH-azoreductase [Cedecea davisae]
MFTALKKLFTRSSTTQSSSPEAKTMSTILHIDTSILGGYSVSRQLSAEIVARQKTLHPNATVIYRDLVEAPALHLSDKHIAAFQGAEVTDAALGADLAVGGAYIDDLFAADVIVLGVPMYNFSIPSQLKAWIDRVCVAGRTFQYGANGPEGLLPKGKKVFIASSRGGQYTGDSPAAFLEHQETYLKAVLGFIGLTDVTVIRAEGVSRGDEVKNAALAEAKEQIAALS